MIDEIKRYLEESKMTDEIKQYFLEQYSKADVRVWPAKLWRNFEEKRNVDHWIRKMRGRAKDYGSKELRPEERPVCSCGKRMSLFYFAGCYEEFYHWQCTNASCPLSFVLDSVDQAQHLKRDLEKECKPDYLDPGAFVN